MTIAILMLTGMLLVLGVIYGVNAIITKERGWKVRKGANFSQVYSELDDAGNWRSVSFDCQLYAPNVPRHALIIDQNWNNYPDWAVMRRQEILDRVRSILREPEYTLIET